MAVETPAHVHARIAEEASRETGVDVSASDVWEILHAKTLGWDDSILHTVRSLAHEYEIGESPEGGFADF